MSAKTLMIQGTTSDSGKSTLVAGLCRLLKNKGISVAPFKPQNMALNSAVTIDRGEIGRAQAVQAQACGLQPHSDMNPVLLKPNTDTAAQVIVQGHALNNMEAAGFHGYKQTAMTAVLDSYHRLAEQYEVILVEGAGSPAEINLRQGDIANMGFAEAIDCPVLLVADIDKGGVFAHLTGTVNLLSSSEQTRIKGFVINKFRGDISLLQPGLDWLEVHSNKKVFGTLPFIEGLHIEAEDAINNSSATELDNPVKIIVPVLPRISNHTDFDALRLHPQVDFKYIGPNQAIPCCDLIILPGSKSVQADLQWLGEQGWQDAIDKHLRYGGKMIGICGGQQMLGKWIHDPDGVEGPPGSVPGLGYLDYETTLQTQKQLARRSGYLYLDQAKVNGYEIHAGISHGPALKQPAIKLENMNDGAISNDDQIFVTYLHGLFDEQEACNSLMAWAGLKQVKSQNYFELREQSLDRLAQIIESSLDIDDIFNQF